MEERTTKCPGDPEVTDPAPAAPSGATPGPRKCPGREAFDRVGDRWSMMVLHHLEAGPLRFSEVRRRVDGLSQKVLTSTLRGLERDGLVARTQYPTIPPRVEYRLTPLGRPLLDLARPLVAWFEASQADIRAHRAAFDARREP